MWSRKGYRGTLKSSWSRGLDPWDFEKGLWGRGSDFVGPAKKLLGSRTGSPGILKSSWSRGPKGNQTASQRKPHENTTKSPRKRHERAPKTESITKTQRNHHENTTKSPRKHNEKTIGKRFSRRARRYSQSPFAILHGTKPHLHESVQLGFEFRAAPIGACKAAEVVDRT